MQRMVIKGSEWHRGGDSANSESVALLTASGRRCCVGIHGRLCGIPDAHLMEVTWPSKMEHGTITECYQYWLAQDYTLGSASDINDAPNTTDEEKITALRPIFAEIGVSIVWRPDL